MDGTFGRIRLSHALDFFVPLHIEHLKDWCPSVLKYLGLPAGWRFLIAPEYEDVWFDSGLLEIGEKGSTHSLIHFMIERVCERL